MDRQCQKALRNKAEKKEPPKQQESGFVSFEDYMAEEGNQNMFADPITAMLNDGVINGDGFVSEMNKAVEEAMLEELKEGKEK